MTETETALAAVAVVVAIVGFGIVTADSEGRPHRNLQVGGGAVLILTLILPIAGLAAAVLGVLLIVKEQVGRGVLLLGASIVVASLAGAVWYSVVLNATTEEVADPTEFVAPEVLDDPGTPPVDECLDPVTYEYIC